MRETKKAVRKDGSEVPYYTTPMMEGTMKRVFFTTDEKSVVAFFKSTADLSRKLRLEKVIGEYNITKDAESGDYFRNVFCWPTELVRSDEHGLGFVAPKYHSDFLFSSGNITGEKKTRWFVRPKLRGMLEAKQRGSWRDYFSLAIKMSRAMRKLHATGLAHSDLSFNNVLIDPPKGSVIIIDCDSLVVPGVFPADVLGTKGYIAPEVLKSSHLALNDPKRVHPTAASDRHAMAVLFYEFLFNRHPLEGPKVWSVESAEQDEHLSFGEKALFIEHPTDKSNRPKDLRHPLEVVGPYLKDLFLRAFVDGLHDKAKRPAAPAWERALQLTWDMLFPCKNGSCTHGWFVLNESSPKCPFCGSRPTGPIAIMKLYDPPNTTAVREIAIYRDGAIGPRLHWWHADRLGARNESTPKSKLDPFGYFALQDGTWLLVNEHDSFQLRSPGGVAVPKGQAVQLANGVKFKLGADLNARVAEIVTIA